VSATYPFSTPHHPAWLLLWLPLLVGLQGVPHTGGGRTLALLAGIIHVVALLRGSPVSLPLARDRFITLTFWMLLVWLVCQTAFIAPVPVAALKALADDWGKLLLMALLGLGLAKVVRKPVWLYVGLFAGAFLHVLSVLGYQADALFSGRGVVFQGSLLSEYPLASSFCVSAIIWLLADAMARYWRKLPLFPWSLRVSLVLLGMALLAEALLGTKSGHVMLAAVGLTAALALLTRPGGSHLRRLTMGVVLLAMLSGVMLQLSGDRWSGLAQSLRAAQAEAISLQVFVTDDTAIPAGTNHSFYMRALRGWQGIEGAIEHPLGIGYGPDVYKRYLKTRFGLDNGIDSSNSGLIDFTLAVGTPGLVLLLLLCAGLIRRGWQAFTKDQVAGLVLVMLVIHQLGRYALDGTIGGSRLTGPVLAIATLWGICRQYLGGPKTS
jgi:hypothetical protein